MLRVILWLGMMAISVLMLAFGACVSTVTPAPTPTLMPNPEASEVPDSVVHETKGPELSDALMRGCERTRASGGFENVGLAVGETAVDFTLQDVHGNTVSLAGLLIEKPVVMVFGSFT